ncbi:MAG: hypothetical protein N2378_05920 [Chloroflexaceae bacterium]|nr:hypothetical protein [Chloroflexaceae bacterium]
MAENRQSFLSHHTLTVPAGQTRRVNVTGTYFLCSESSAPFRLRLGDREATFFSAGLAVRFQPGDWFAFIEITNPGSADNEIEFFVGTAEVIDARLNVVTDRPPAAVTVHITPPKTYLKTHTITSLAPAAEESCPGTDSGNRRKEILVTNLDGTNDLEIRTAAGASIGFVLARTAWVLETDDDLKVVNSAAAAIACRIAEVFYDGIPA